MKKIIHMLLAFALCHGLALSGGTYAMAADLPNYTVTQTFEDKVELRAYPPSLIAQVRVSGERDEAANKAFRVLAGFIFSGNERDEKIAMTAPVTQIPESFTHESQAQVWTIDFRMPYKYTAQTLPKPNDENISILELPSQSFVAIEFSGRGTQKNLSKHREKLTEILDAHPELNVDPKPIYAFYNPPILPGFMRRNEVMFRVLP